MPPLATDRPQEWRPPPEWYDSSPGDWMADAPNAKELDLADKIALPSLLGEALGETMLGHPWKPFPFISDIEREIVAACVDDTKQDWFIVNCPNQVGKTTYVGLWLVFWYIGMFPDKQVIFISYSDAFSARFGRQVRDLFRKYGEELFGVTVDPNQDGAGDWKLKGHPAGGMLSVGISGQITGRQGHFVIIDDILRDMIDAASQSIKDAHWANWGGVIWGRRQPGSVYVVTATRLVEDDLTGRLRKQMRDRGGRGIQWVELIYPGICEPPEDYDGDPDEYRDRLGRKPGDPLLTRFSQVTDTVEHNWWTLAQEELDNQVMFDCMVQQNPQRGDTGMFPESKWRFELREDWPTLFNQARAWDLASTEGAGDYTTGSLVGKSTDGDYYIVHRFREQVSSEVGLQAVKDHAAADGYGVKIIIEQERSGAGKNLVAYYERELKGYHVVAARADGTKEQRAKPYSIVQQGGHVVLPADDEDREWVKEWVKEHKGMMGDGRRPRHDDQIDTAAYAVLELSESEVAEWVDPNDWTDDDFERRLQMEEQLAQLGL